MNNLDQKNTKVSYEGFIFNYQFQRKIPIGYFIYTRVSILSILAAVISTVTFYYLGEEYEEYLFYPLIAAGIFLIIRFPKCRLTFSSKLGLIHKNKSNDEEEKSIYLFSKISWFLKKHYNAKKILRHGVENAEQKK